MQVWKTWNLEDQSLISQSVVIFSCQKSNPTWITSLFLSTSFCGTLTRCLMSCAMRCGSGLNWWQQWMFDGKFSYKWNYTFFWETGDMLNVKFIGEPYTVVEILLWECNGHSVNNDLFLLLYNWPSHPVLALILREHSSELMPFIRFDRIKLNDDMCNQ